MFWSLKIIRIGPKPSKIAKYILENFPSFFRFFCKMTFSAHFPTFWYRSLKTFSRFRQIGMYQFLSWFGSRGYHEIPDFENQKIIRVMYVRDNTENFVLCENYAFRFTTEVAGLMQPPKPVLELLTAGNLQGADSTGNTPCQLWRTYYASESTNRE